MPDTQMAQTVSRDTEVFRDAKDHISARTIILQGDGQVRYYLSLSVLRGGPNGPKILTMSSNGTPLDYTMHDRLNTFCIDRCHRTEIGAIALTEQAFRKGANYGMVIEIDGQRRNYTATVPHHIFWTALDAAGLLAPTIPRVSSIP